MSRIISGKLRLDVQPLDLDHRHRRRRRHRRARPPRPRRSASRRCSIPRAGAVSRRSRSRCSRCVWNLLSNAIKFTPSGGRVQVQLQRVELPPRDHGERHRPRHRGPISSPMSSTASARPTPRPAAPRRPGPGARHRAATSSSCTAARSRRGTASDRQGAIFTVTLPLMVIRKPAEPAKAEASTLVHPAVSGTVPFDCPPDLQGVKVLAIDDEADARHLLQTVLDSAGPR